MTCKECKFYEKECDAHFHQELMGRKRSMEICEIFYPKEPRLIEANCLIEDLKAAEANGGMGSVVARTLMRYVKRCKTVDAVEVVHGRWMEFNTFMTCSVCDTDWYYGDNDCDRFDYCPNCGAKMDGDSND